MTAHVAAYGDKIDGIGVVTQPSGGGTIVLEAGNTSYPWFWLRLTLTGATFATHDGTTSGAYGTLPIFTFQTGVVRYLSCSQIYTALVESSAVDTGAGDIVHVLAVGTAAIAAAQDKTFAATATCKDIGDQTSDITNSGGTGSGTKFSASTALVDGRSTAAKLNLNWSGGAATSDADGTMSVTGTITVAGMFL